MTVGGLTAAGVAFVLAVSLAATLLVAAWSKLRDRPAVVEAFDAMGLAAPELLSVVVPIVEIVAAGLLVTLPPVGAAVSLLVLVVFTVVLARLKDRGIPCRCFGGGGTEPVSNVDLVRNGLLITVSLIVFLVAPDRLSPSVAEWVAGLALFGIGAAGLQVAKR